MKKILLIGLFLAFANTIFAKIDKIRLILLPSNTYVVAWNQVSGKSPIVCYDEAGYFFTEKQLQKVQKPYKSNKKYGMNTFFAKFSDLEADKIYYLKITDSEGQSQLYWFHTLPENPDTISIIAGGDSRSNPDIRLLADKMAGKLQPDLIVFDGDFTVSSTGKQWQQWLDDWQSTIVAGRLIPIVVAEGNHEKGTALQILFDAPEHCFYSLQFGNLLHLTILNSEYDLNAQTGWLENDLKQDSSIWKISVFHKPMRPHYSGKRDGEDIYQAWAKIFWNYRVNAVLEGDTHMAKITYPIRPSDEKGSEDGFIRDDKTGTVYLGEGTWGAPLRPADKARSWTLDMASINQFKLLYVTKEKIEVRTIKYENADKVKAVDFEKRYSSLPQNLDLWKPAGMDVVTINARR